MRLSRRLKGEGTDDPTFHGGKCSVPAGSEYQEDAEAGKRAEEYHDSSLRAADKGYQ